MSSLPRLRLSTYLAVFITVLLALALLGAGAYTSYRAREATERLAEKIVSDNVQSVRDQVASLLQEAERKSGTLAEMAGSFRKLDAVALNQLRPEMVAMMRASRDIDYLSYTSGYSGEFCMVSRSAKDELLWQVNRRKPGGGFVREDFRVLRTGRLQLVRKDPQWKVDSRTRPYFTLAARGRKPTWTEPYVFIGGDGNPDPGITHATPTIVAGNVVGVATADFSLRGLSKIVSTIDFAREGKSESAGVAFIAAVFDDGARRIIAHPDLEQVLAKGATGPELRRMADMTDQTAKRVLATGKRADEETTVTGTGFVLRQGSTVSIVSSAPLQRVGLRWQIYAVAPESFFSRELAEARRLVMGFSAAMLVVGLLVGYAVSRRITRPLSILARQAASVQRLEIDPSPLESAGIREIAQLAASVESMKTGLRSFTRLVPKEYVRYLIRHDLEVVPGGERREMSVMFADLTGFTGLAEQLSPEELIRVLTRFFDIASAAVQATGGIVDKYNGDDVMAFWGAPDEVENVAASAIDAMLQIQSELAAIVPEHGEVQFAARIGVATGSVFVGNLGTRERMNYTVIGDRVNIAARLQGLGKFYGVDSVIDDETLRKSGRPYRVRPLDKVGVAGRNEGVVVYEVRGMADEAHEADQAFCLDFTAAFERYQARDFDGAARDFEALRSAHLDDRACQILTGRCRVYATNPPADDWDGTFNLTHK
jgi:adenylate cyclase